MLWICCTRVPGCSRRMPARSTSQPVCWEQSLGSMTSLSPSSLGSKLSRRQDQVCLPYHPPISPRGSPRCLSLIDFILSPTLFLGKDPVAHRGRQLQYLRRDPLCRQVQARCLGTGQLLMDRLWTE